MTVIDSDFAFAQDLGRPDRPEPAHVESPRLNYAAVLRKFRWTDAQFDVAQRFGLPTSMLKTSAARDANEAGGARWEKVWPEDVLDVWAHTLMREVSSLHLKA